MVTTNLLQQDELWAGDRIGDYIVLERIGIGGESTVWSAWDEQLSRVVALKFFYGAGEANVISLVESEATLVQKLDHPNIVNILEVGRNAANVFFVMRYFPHGSLANHLAETGPLPVQEALQTIAQMVNALDYLHQNNVVHRDLKPTNVLMDVEKHVYLTDFGLSKQLTETTRAIHTGHGTPQYSPPEQHTRAPIQTRSDIYSLGIILYEIFTGSLPWNGEMALAIKQLERGDKLPDPKEINPALPEGLADALRCMTNSNPDHRPPDVQAAYSMIASAFDGASANGSYKYYEVLSAVPPIGGIDDFSAKEAAAIFESEQITFQRNGRIGLNLTQFAFLHSVYSRLLEKMSSLAPTIHEYMALGATTLGFKNDYWWKYQGDPEGRFRLYQQALAQEDEDAAQRAVSFMLRDHSLATFEETTLLPLLIALVNLAVESPNAILRTHIIKLLNGLIRPIQDWQLVRLSYEADKNVASIAFLDEEYAQDAAHLIGMMKSEAAVQVLLGNLENSSESEKIATLIPILETAHDLPSSFSPRIRRILRAELARKQISDNPAEIGRVLGMAILAGFVAIGVHVYGSYRVPDFLSSARILNALGSGLIIGPIIGFGISIARLVVSRLSMMRSPERILLGTALGTLGINLGFVTYHKLFLDANPVGWSILLGSLVWALAHTLSTAISRFKWMQAVVCVFITAAGSLLSWFTAQYYQHSPIFYYENTGQPLMILLVAITSMVIGLMPSIFTPLAAPELKDRMNQVKRP